MIYGQVLVFEEKIKYDHVCVCVNHIIDLCEKQIYFLKNLHITPHYTISTDQVNTFKEKCIYQKMKVQHYQCGMSHFNDFLIIINYNTRHWSSEVNDLFKNIQFDVLQNMFLTEKRDKNRNNYQKSFGFCNQSFTAYTKKNISQPKLYTNTLEPIIIETMELLTAILNKLKKLGYISKDEFDSSYRNKIFAQQMSLVNCIEGLTVASNDISHKLKDHVDTKNCAQTNYNGVIGVCLIQNQNRRTVLLGYGKKVCYDYMLRRSRCVVLTSSYYYIVSLCSISIYQLQE